MANLTLKLAEHVTNVGARAAYGEPIEQDGTKIIPVALACFGFGAGEVGDSGESGGGGGGGLLSTSRCLRHTGRCDSF